MILYDPELVTKETVNCIRGGKAVQAKLVLFDAWIEMRMLSTRQSVERKTVSNLSFKFNSVHKFEPLRRWGPMAGGGHLHHLPPTRTPSSPPRSSLLLLSSASTSPPPPSYALCLPCSSLESTDSVYSDALLLEPGVSITSKYRRPSGARVLVHTKCLRGSVVHDSSGKQSLFYETFIVQRRTEFCAKRARDVVAIRP